MKALIPTLLCSALLSAQELELSGYRLDCDGLTLHAPCPAAVTFRISDAPAYRAHLLKRGARYQLAVGWQGAGNPFAADTAFCLGKVLLAPAPAGDSLVAASLTLVPPRPVPGPAPLAFHLRRIADGRAAAAGSFSGGKGEPIVARAGRGAARIANPILFVHGLFGIDTTWNPAIAYLEGKGLLRGGRFDICLNRDGLQGRNLIAEDVRDFTAQGLLRAGDFYVMNFDVDSSGAMTGKDAPGVQSNQEAIHKQGHAVGMAVRRIRELNGGKPVMLAGHSMGGLAAREYVQNTAPNRLKAASGVASIVTIGTPHGGSNAARRLSLLGGPAGMDTHSNAVRDLRTSYTDDKPGVFLFGGNEQDVYSATEAGGLSDGYHKDVDCNGSDRDDIVGLNRREFPGGVYVRCAFGRFRFETEGFPNGDGVVLARNASLFNYYDLGYVDTLSAPMIHTELHRSAALVHMMIDEPDLRAYAQEVVLRDSAGRERFALWSFNQGRGAVDADWYRIEVKRAGSLSLEAGNITAPAAALTLYDAGGMVFTESAENRGSVSRIGVRVAAGSHWLKVERAAEEFSRFDAIHVRGEVASEGAIAVRRLDGPRGGPGFGSGRALFVAGFAGVMRDLLGRRFP